jgi:cell wall-associated NlpC family hydrolase
MAHNTTATCLTTTGQALPAWVAGYVGLPYKKLGRSRHGVDCWGLVRLVLVEQFGQDLPEYGEVGEAPTQTRKAISDFIVARRDEGWQEIPAGEEQPGDVALLRAFGVPFHVGVVLGGGLMLHAEAGADSCWDSYQTSFKWHDRVLGFYRHAAA